MSDPISQQAIGPYRQWKDKSLSNADFMSGIFDLVQRPLTGFIRSNLGYADDSWKDVFQEVMLKLVRKIGELDLETVPLMAWLYATTRNHIIDEKRKAVSHQSDKHDDITSLDKRPIQPEQNQSEWIFRNALAQALSDKPPEWVVAIELHYYEGLTIAETANVMGVTDSDVNYYLRLAKAFLANHPELIKRVSHA